MIRSAISERAYNLDNRSLNILRWRVRKRLIFRYDRKIPDYFSVAGAP